MSQPDGGPTLSGVLQDFAILLGLAVVMILAAGLAGLLH